MRARSKPSRAPNVGQRHHPVPQRARQYRNRDHAHAGVRARAGNRLSSKAIPPTAPTRNACACKEAYAGKHDIKVLRQDGKGKGDAVRKAFAECDRRHPDDPRRRSHHAAGSICRNSTTRSPAARPRSSTASRLVYPMEDEAMRPLNLHRQPLFRARVQLAGQPALHRHVVRHQGADARSITTRSRAIAPISAISIRSAISI